MSFSADSRWSAFVWFLIWFSIFRGVGLTGRVVYFTMGLPIVTTIIFVGRALALENAGAGVRLLWATWRGDQLANGTVWQTAVGQVFFSTGIGFGYFTSYASYNQKHSNAVSTALYVIQMLITGYGCCLDLWFECFVRKLCRLCRVRGCW